MVVAMSLTHVALTGAAFTLAYIGAYVFYNLFLHPLRSIPGPLFGRATIVYFQKKTADGVLPFWLHELHQQYGPVVRYAPNEVSFTDPDVVKEVYSHRGMVFEKQTDFYGPDSYGNPPGLIRSDKVAHARQRRLVSHAFSDRALHEQQGLLKGYVNTLVEKLKEKAATNELFDIVPWYNFTTFDIMADLTFGESLQMLQKSDYSPWVKGIFSAVKFITVTSVLRRWQVLNMLSQRAVPKKMIDERKRHLDFAKNSVDKRLALKTDRPDIWTYILRHSGKEDQSLFPTEMYSNGALFMLAGTETTATQLSGMTYFLLKNPEKMERVKKEVREAFSSFEDIEMVKLQQLGYLNACMDETLRLYPPVVVNLPRLVPKGGSLVNGHWMPEGTCIGLATYSAYHSECYFKNADSFIPERWMPEGQAEYGADRKDVFIPFSSGPRNCVGKNLAYHEMRLIFSSVLLHFDIELADDRVWTDQKVYTLWDKIPLMVKLTPAKVQASESGVAHVANGDGVR